MKSFICYLWVMDVMSNSVLGHNGGVVREILIPVSVVLGYGLIWGYGSLDLPWGGNFMHHHFCGPSFQLMYAKPMFGVEFFSRSTTQKPLFWAFIKSKREGLDLYFLLLSFLQICYFSLTSLTYWLHYKLNLNIGIHPWNVHRRVLCGLCRLFPVVLKRQFTWSSFANY